MNLLVNFLKNIKQHNLFNSKDKLLLAVSGGVDSVVLCELCKQGGFDFTIAHCNFQLRGEESERDSDFVKKLAHKYGVIFLVKKFETKKYAAEKKISIQEAAREMRYNWFAELINQSTHQQINYILTAHHANDNIETVLMNFFKGTGIAGLRGILPRHGKVIRPLLFAKKAALISFAQENHLDWVEDNSNLSDEYSRNYVRNQLIPVIQEIYPEAENNLLDNLQRFSETEILYHQAITQYKKKLLEIKGNEVHIPVLKLKKAVPLRSILFEIIREFGFSPAQVNDVIALLDSDSGKYIRSVSHRVIKNRNWLIIAPNENLLAGNILIEEGTEEVEFANGKLKLENELLHSGFKFPDSTNIACLDATMIEFPLLLRRWKQGDYFYPLGMKQPHAARCGKKKLARFFIDEKLSKTEKEKIWVLEMNKKIIWVIGKRIDDRFKISGNTKTIIRITLANS